MIVDVHAHLVPPDFLLAIRKESTRTPSLRLIENEAGLALAFAGGKPSRPIGKGLSDVAGRVSWMAAQSTTARSSAAGPTGSAMNCRRGKEKSGAACSMLRSLPPQKPSPALYRWRACRCRMARAPRRSSSQPWRKASPVR
jgi:hypothetical protein